MNNETMMEQIRRLNEQEAVKHELKRQAAINKIKQMRLQKELNGRTTIPQ
jgi:hypothetical protein